MLRDLARGALDAAHVDALDDPRILARHSGYWPEPHYVHIASDAPRYELAAGGVIRYRHNDEENQQFRGDFVRLGFSELYLLRHVIERPSIDLIFRLACRLVWTDDVLPADLVHPYSTPEFLRAAIMLRRSTMSGIYRIPATA